MKNKFMHVLIFFLLLGFPFLLDIPSHDDICDENSSCLAYRYSDMDIGPYSMILTAGPPAGASMYDSYKMAPNEKQKYYSPIAGIHEKNESINEYALNVYPADYGPYATGFGHRAIQCIAQSKLAEDSLKMLVIARKIRAKIAELSGEDDYLKHCNKNLLKPVLLSIGFKQNGKITNTKNSFYLNSGLQKSIFFSGATIIDNTGDYSIFEMLYEGYLPLAFTHETSHAIMMETYGTHWKSLLERKLSTPHDDVTDPATAYMEGWAEAFEIIYMKNNDRLLSNRSQDDYQAIVRDMILSQSNDNDLWFSYDPATTSPVELSPGCYIKNASQMISSENIIAGLFSSILSSKEIKFPFIKCIAVMYEHHPTDFMEFLSSWVKEFPADNDYLVNLLCEKTKFAIVLNEAPETYYECRKAEREFLKNKISKEELEKKREAWRNLSDALKSVALRNTTLTQSRPSLGLIFIRPEGPDGSSRTETVDLVTITAPTFKALKIKGISDNDIVEFIKIRQRKALNNYSDALCALENVLGKRFEFVKKNNSLFSFNFAPTGKIEKKGFFYGRGTQYEKLSSYLEKTRSADILNELAGGVRK